MFFYKIWQWVTTERKMSKRTGKKKTDNRHTKKLYELYPHKHRCWHTVFCPINVSNTNDCSEGLDTIGKSNRMNFNIIHFKNISNQQGAVF